MSQSIKQAAQNNLQNIRKLGADVINRYINHNDGSKLV
jgi:hypothetical protein